MIIDEPEKLTPEIIKDMQDFYREYFKNFELPEGEVSRHDENEIETAYRVIFLGEEIPKVNMMPECRFEYDGVDKRTKILLKCVKAGKPYRLPPEIEEEIRRLEEAGIPYDF